MAGLLDFVSDPQARADMRIGLLDAANRGVVAGLLGAPVDLATLALRPLGYGVEKPVGGSEWIGQKMQDAGMVSAQRNPLAEALAGLAIPAAAYRAAPALFAAEQAVARNAATKTPFNARTMGQGGGLPMPAQIDDAERARRMADAGMERGWFRGGPTPQGGLRTGPWYTQDADEAASYAARFGNKGDVREYALPKAGFLDAAKSYDNRLAHDVARIVDTPEYGKPGAQLAKELRSFQGDERIIGGHLWQALEARFGNDGAAQTMDKLGAFSGVKNITHGPEVMMFKSAPVRDANLAAFNPDRMKVDDIYGFTTPEFAAALAGVSGGLGLLAPSFLDKRSSPR